MTAENAYLKALGARIQSEANDLKRTPEALASELGVSGQTVESVLSGAADLDTAQNLLCAMTEAYPISLADVWIDADETDHGVRVMSAAASESSSRIFDRINKDGDLTPYYEYRDTAMSRGAPFKPEWILELRTVDDAEADNPDIAFNNGHLMHQTTFFIGPVNFYWETDGKRHCAELDTGDSNYITPFVPHSFASRDKDQPGLIIAITFSGLVGRALRDFTSIGADAANRAAGDLRSNTVFHDRLKRHCAAESIQLEELEKRAAAEGIDSIRANAILQGVSMPTMDEIAILANLLTVRISDLMVHPLERSDEVVIQKFHDGRSRLYPNGNSPAYRITELARSRQQPYMKGFELTVLGGDGGDGGEFEHSLHQYVYNYGDQPVKFLWGPKCTAILNPGDSACIRPMVRHRFERPKGASEGHLVVIRVSGQLTDQVLDEYATFATGGRDRVAGETRRWF